MAPHPEDDPDPFAHYFLPDSVRIEVSQATKLKSLLRKNPLTFYEDLLGLYSKEFNEQLTYEYDLFTHLKHQRFLYIEDEILVRLIKTPEEIPDPLIPIPPMNGIRYLNFFIKRLKFLAGSEQCSMSALAKRYKERFGDMFPIYALKLFDRELLYDFHQIERMLSEVYFVGGASSHLLPMNCFDKDGCDISTISIRVLLHRMEYLFDRKTLMQQKIFFIRYFNAFGQRLEEHFQAIVPHLGGRVELVDSNGEWFVQFNPPTAENTRLTGIVRLDGDCTKGPFLERCKSTLQIASLREPVDLRRAESCRSVNDPKSESLDLLRCASMIRQGVCRDMTCFLDQYKKAHGKNLRYVGKLKQFLSSIPGIRFDGIKMSIEDPPAIESDPPPEPVVPPESSPAVDERPSGAPKMEPPSSKTLKQRMNIMKLLEKPSKTFDNLSDLSKQYAQAFGSQLIATREKMDALGLCVIEEGSSIHLDCRKALLEILRLGVTRVLDVISVFRGSHGRYPCYVGSFDVYLEALGLKPEPPSLFDALHDSLAKLPSSTPYDVDRALVKYNEEFSTELESTEFVELLNAADYVTVSNSSKAFFFGRFHDSCLLGVLLLLEKHSDLSLSDIPVRFRSRFGKELGLDGDLEGALRALGLYPAGKFSKEPTFPNHRRLEERIIKRMAVDIVTRKESPMGIEELREKLWFRISDYVKDNAYMAQSAEEFFRRNLADSGLIFGDGFLFDCKKSLDVWSLRKFDANVLQRLKLILANSGSILYPQRLSFIYSRIFKEELTIEDEDDFLEQIMERIPLEIQTDGRGCLYLRSLRRPGAGTSSAGVELPDLFKFSRWGKVAAEMKSDVLDGLSGFRESIAAELQNRLLRFEAVEEYVDSNIVS